jgi:hypothetical protein
MVQEIRIYFGCFLTGKNKDVWTLLPTDLQGLQSFVRRRRIFFFKDKPTFWAIEEEFLHSYKWKVKTGKSSRLVENNRKNL